MTTTAASGRATSQPAWSAAPSAPQPPIATAPFAAPIGGDSYARLNGFVCTPGTWFRGEDGRRHLCQ